ncbi:MAG: A/G-specific adenine glycosylase [Sulfuricurvum sp.]|uniref:A/G-specific adenine glycosylase n=1 Tax=Sulfuricurvum sp. TaxID=2025608 RepID=UPI002602FA4D|nr:A/G-specific adenine glycosylase [Sulfuricurvum sp.]MDD2837720.1 A/G-specific adenine glycosylase [Sulfuricurvum sp.]MDD3595433.1 A/G-specific adenine glycosylase [Sulfuricurvum sp.]MDD4884362.1 A/G-specific adenine glycosylase [Sulfuricurvum sp.]
MKYSPQQSLLIWYEKNGRHTLPWRLTKDPYPIWISEIMLQQTQVKTVLERFYFPFLERFPSLEALAEAQLDDVLKMWEGLGYYTRARNLHTAARECRGTFPRTAHDMISLPGIGRSTAHAIASFAYNEPLPILDANVKRILHRFFALSKRDEKQLWTYAYQLFDPNHPFEYNQAMMDVGATVCLAKKPLCDVCPFKPACLGKGSPDAYPEKKTTRSKPMRTSVIRIYRRDNRYALMQRSSRFLHGLWGFSETVNLPIGSTDHFLGDITQHYSHFTLAGTVYLSDEPFEDERFEWFSLDEIKELSLSRADHKAMALLRYNLDQKREDGC